MSCPESNPLAPWARRLAPLLLLVACAASGDAFDDAAAAYKRGEFETAAPAFEALANKGDHRAMSVIASMYAAGQGVAQSHRQAFTWFRAAAKYNRPDAQFRLGLMYDAGLGLKSDQRKAVRWYRKAARQGYPDARVMMGLKYLKGEGFKQNKVKAYAWLSLARPFLESRPAGAQDASEFEGMLQPADVLAELEALESELDDDEKAQARQLLLEWRTEP